MCGIAYMKSMVGMPVNIMIRDQFRRQRSRGTDGFGMAYTTGSSVKIMHKTEEADMMALLKKTRSTEILFHHRIPTSTANVLSACHPFTVTGYKTGHKYIIVHNGILYNDDILKDKHYKLGYKYSSMQKNGQFNDSEALAYEIMLAFENNAWEDFDAEGSIAFICQEIAKNGRPIAVHFARNAGSPMKMKYNQKTLQLASELNGQSIEENKLYSINHRDMTMATKDIKMKEGSYSGYCYQNNYGYYEDVYGDNYEGIYTGVGGNNPSYTKAEKYLPDDSFFQEKKSLDWFYTKGEELIYKNYQKEYCLQSIEMLGQRCDKEIEEMESNMDQQCSMYPNASMEAYYAKEIRIEKARSAFLWGMAEGIYQFNW